VPDVGQQATPIRRSPSRCRESLTKVVYAIFPRCVTTETYVNRPEFVDLLVGWAVPQTHSWLRSMRLSFAPARVGRDRRSEADHIQRSSRRPLHADAVPAHLAKEYS
jgi:hypothetical protein